MARVDALTQRLVAALSKGRHVPTALQGPSQELYSKAAGAYWTEMINNPAKLIEHQLSFWSKSVSHFVEAQALIAHGKIAAPEDKTPTDRRFSHDLWRTNPYFNFVKQQYMINAEAITNAIDAVETLDPGERGAYAISDNRSLICSAPQTFWPPTPKR